MMSCMRSVTDSCYANSVFWKLAEWVHTTAEQGPMHRKSGGVKKSWLYSPGWLLHVLYTSSFALASKQAQQEGSKLRGCLRLFSKLATVLTAFYVVFLSLQTFQQRQPQQVMEVKGHKSEWQEVRPNVNHNPIGASRLLKALAKQRASSLTEHELRLHDLLSAACSYRSSSSS